MPEKDKNNQEGPDVRGNLIKVNVGGDTIFVDSNQYKPQVEHAKKLKQQHRNRRILSPKNGSQKNTLSIKLLTISHLTLLMVKGLDAAYM